ncbi:MAG: holo-ACP synthase, partial [Actinobacteria bacterium]|nr:holo-ACP synthase [Actinomycetota bacterium]
MGVGVDLVAIAPFAEQLSTPGTRFSEAFTAAERSLGAPGTPESHRLAGRWAAKEAFLKAWAGARRGRSPATGEVVMGEIEVYPDAWGRPGLRLHGAIAAIFAESLPGVDAHLSISHDGDHAIAFVVLNSPNPAAGDPNPTPTFTLTPTPT